MKSSDALKNVPIVAVLRGNTARIAQLAIDEVIKEKERRFRQEKMKRIFDEE